MSSVLVQEIDKAERFVYFTSKVFKGVEIHYQKIQKLALAVVIAARKFNPYFQGHNILVKTNYLVQQVLKKPDLEGNMVSWSVEISEYDIQYIPKGIIKSQALIDFIAELSLSIDEYPPSKWALYMDDASNVKGRGAWIMVERSSDIVIEQALKFKFTDNNNQAEYKAPISGMILSLEMGATRLKAKSDSQLVINQVSGKY